MFKKSKYITLIELEKQRIMYNSITKAYMKVNYEFNLDNIVDLLNDGHKNESDFRDLIENGYIIESNRSEFDEIKYIFNKSYFNENSLSIALMPSMACNFSCPYCFEEPYRQSTSNTPLYFDTLKKFAENNFKYYNHVEISLFGGEPLLYFMDMVDYLDYVSDLAEKEKFTYSTSITTNGSLVTTEVMEVLKKHNCNSFQITLDGSRRTHDKTRRFTDGRPSFDKLINIINTVIGPYLVNHKYNLTLRFNLLNNTKTEIEDSLLLIDEVYRSYISVFFRAVYNTADFKDSNSNDSSDYADLISTAYKQGYRIMNNQYHCRSCEACTDQNFGYITPDLSFWKCLNYHGIGKDGYGRFGYISSEGLLKLNTNRVVEWYKASNCFEDFKCKDCSQLPDCLGGCIIHYLANGKRLCSEFNLTSLPFLYNE